MQQVDIDDEQLARDIAAKLGDTPGISYTEIASNALDQGRTALAIRVGCRLRLSVWAVLFQDSRDHGFSQLAFLSTQEFLFFHPPRSAFCVLKIVKNI